MLKGKEMNQFEEKLNTNQDKLKQIASEAVKSAVQKGASECEVSIGGVKGLSVTSRNCEVENIVFNRDNGMDITVYKNKKRGSASTTDLSYSPPYWLPDWLQLYTTLFANSESTL